MSNHSSDGPPRPGHASRHSTRRVSHDPRRRLVALTTARSLDRASGWCQGSASLQLGRPVVRRVVAATALLAGVLTIGGGAGVVVGLAVAVGVLRLRAPAPDADVDVARLPLVVDLLAGSLRAGASWAAAVDAAGAAVDGRLAQLCHDAAVALRDGAPAEAAWQCWFAVPELAPVARIVTRTATTGAASAAELGREAARMRTRRQAQARQRVARASVWVVVPLGLCFLPAFVLVAVVPLVAGLLPSL